MSLLLPLYLEEEGPIFLGASDFKGSYKPKILLQNQSFKDISKLWEILSQKKNCLMEDTSEYWFSKISNT